MSPRFRPQLRTSAVHLRLISAKPFSDSSRNGIRRRLSVSKCVINAGFSAASAVLALSELGKYQPSNFRGWQSITNANAAQPSQLTRQGINRSTSVRAAALL